MLRVRVFTSLVLTICLAVAAAFSTSSAAAAGDDLVQQIVKLLGNPDREFRAAALEQVRKAAPGKANTQTFAAQLPKLDPSAQAALIIALGDRGDAAAHAAIADRLKFSKDEGIRVAGFTALGNIGSVDDLPLLIDSLSTGTDGERKAARTALIRMRGDQVVKTLAKDATLAQPQTCAALLDVLAARRAISEMPVFLAASVADDAKVREAAMSALGQIGNPRDLAAMIAGVLKAEKGAERDAAERNVAAVCSRIDPEDARADALISAINSTGATDRDQLLPLMGRVGGKRLINYVADIATSSDASRRPLAIDALSKWPDASPADNLLEIASAASNPADRKQAFQGYVKIAATRDGRSDKERLDRMKQAMRAAKTPEEESLVINRARTAYDVETLRFVLPYLDQAAFTQITCETIVELAHHREIRDPNKAEFDKALDQVIKLSKDEEVIDRAGRYKRGETWTRPKK